jgi:hypothetical protein
VGALCRDVPAGIGKKCGFPLSFEEYTEDQTEETPKKQSKKAALIKLPHGLSDLSLLKRPKVYYVRNMIVSLV